MQQLHKLLCCYEHCLVFLFAGYVCQVTTLIEPSLKTDLRTRGVKFGVKHVLCHIGYLHNINFSRRRQLHGEVDFHELQAGVSSCQLCQLGSIVGK
jgi:hypothetical protein